MKKIVIVLFALVSLWSITSFADDALPEIAPIDETAAPAIDAAASDEATAVEATSAEMPAADEVAK
jgi:hypothetical protein